MARLILWLLAFLSLNALVRVAPASAEACQRPTASLPLLHLAQLKSDEVAIRFVGHATFTIQSPQGVVAATDYNDYVRPRDVPTIATMNHAHSTHYSLRPDPGIRHVLRGWTEGAVPPTHDVQEGDMRVRNVPTNIRDNGFTAYSGNSIFIFEVAGLCIAHLGHLHHTLTPEHLAAIGQVDVLMAPVDGSYTLDLDGMMEVIGQLQPRVILPMHWFGPSTLERFLARMETRYPVMRLPEPMITLSRAKLPSWPAIMVLSAP
ncbi:MAG: MBL fold metallo-hydrolase [Proteobacteria bacterium]|nr:MBL fold metallo-hydrolase [Pseudomonadota bacterium]